MRIAEVKFTRKWNIGDYNSEELGGVALVEEGEDPRKAIRELIEIITTKGAETVSVATKNVVEILQKKAEEVVVTETPEIPPFAGVNIVKEEPVKLLPKIEDDEAPEVFHTDEAEPAARRRGRPRKEVAPAAAPAPAPVVEEKKTGKRFVMKKIAYTRSEDIHRKLLGEILDKEFSGWRKNGIKAKEASMAMEGKDFLDEDGVVLREFVEEFRKIYQG